MLQGKQELVSLACILFYRPVHGLIFLFKWQPGEEPAGSVVQDSRLDTIFFAKQVRSVMPRGGGGGGALVGCVPLGSRPESFLVWEPKPLLKKYCDLQKYFVYGIIH